MLVKGKSGIATPLAKRGSDSQQALVFSRPDVGRRSRVLPLVTAEATLVEQQDHANIICRNRFIEEPCCARQNRGLRSCSGHLETDGRVVMVWSAHPTRSWRLSWRWRATWAASSSFVSRGGRHWMRVAEDCSALLQLSVRCTSAQWGCEGRTGARDHTADSAGQ